MRLLEIESNIPRPNPVNNTLLTVLNFLKGKADPTVDSIRVPVQTVLALMKNAGSNFSYQDIEQLKNTDEAVGALIKNVDPTNLIINVRPAEDPLGTEGDEDTAQDQQDAAAGVDSVTPEPEVDPQIGQMAQRAASRKPS